MLANDASPNEISRGALEALPAGTHVVLEAQHLIQIDDMAANQINLAPDLAVQMTVFAGDIVFQDVQDQMFTVGGGSFQFDAPNGNVVLGQVSAPGGSITIQAGMDATFHTLSTTDLSSSRLPGNVVIESGRDILLGATEAGNTRLEAGRNILNSPTHPATLHSSEASFVAGDQVGSSSDPLFIEVPTISGLAREFNFSFDGAPSSEGLVNGINGLNIRQQPAPPTPDSAPPPPLPVPGRLDSSRVDQVPVFQINENVAGFYQPPKVVEAPAADDRPQGSQNEPQKLGETSDGFAFLLVGRLQKNVQVCDSQKFIYQLGPEGLMPWIEAFAAHGFRVRTTDEHFEAWRGGERAEGIVSGQRFFLKVGPHSCFAASDDDADLQGLLAWLLQSRQFPVLSQARMVDTTRLKLQANLPELVGQLKGHGWSFAPGSLTAVQGHYRLQLKPVGASIWLTLSRIP